ncbi:hypothetical protein C8F04DRAFT_1177712 [Mycena alexandri]|uniref:Uncharacterized protein n=1 Tax=Mycena alexandri TaxID=1745969 RepID=A0AAD6T7Q4_9AGAR|nr:hypothetical protein C8F04DRAFT_1177712 [Mycena alexandri]
MSTSADTIRTLHPRPSPPHSPFQSPPDSPSLSASGSSVSSFPSVNSSFFFSSAAASPPHGPTPLPVEETLIIPSLTLPALLMRPKEAQGPVTRLLVLGDPHVAAAALFVDNPDALDPSAWAYEDGFRVLRTSTQWREPDDRVDTDLNDDINHSSGDPNARSSTSTPPGSDRTNIELVALGEDVHQLDVPTIEDRILSPFRRIATLLAPPLLSSSHEEELLTALLVGPEAPLYTALLVVSPCVPTPSTSDPSAPTSSSGVSLSPSASSSVLDSVAFESALPQPASNVGHPSTHFPHPAVSPADDIPAALQRLVPLLVLVPTPAPVHPPSAPPSEHDPDPDGPNDTTAGEIPAPAPTPPTARLPPQIPQLVGCEFESGRHHNNTHTPASLRCLLRSPKARGLRIDAAARFVTWWRAGGVDPYARLQPQPPSHSYEVAGSGFPRVAKPLHASMRRDTYTVRTREAQAQAPPCYPSYAPHGDPLHLPSLLALARDVVRASFASVRGRVERSGWAFVAGVLLGVGMGVWASASA